MACKRLSKSTQLISRKTLFETLEAERLDKGLNGTQLNPVENHLVLTAEKCSPFWVKRSINTYSISAFQKIWLFVLGHEHGDFHAYIKVGPQPRKFYCNYKLAHLNSFQLQLFPEPSHCWIDYAAFIELIEID